MGIRRRSVRSGAGSGTGMGAGMGLVLRGEDMIKKEIIYMTSFTGYVLVLRLCNIQNIVL